MIPVIAAKIARMAGDKIKKRLSVPTDFMVVILIINVFVVIGYSYILYVR